MLLLPRMFGIRSATYDCFHHSADFFFFFGFNHWDNKMLKVKNHKLYKLRVASLNGFCPNTPKTKVINVLLID